MEEAKFEEQSKHYNPWGKQGAGAPMRDDEGHIVASRLGYFTTDSGGTLPPYYPSETSMKGQQKNTMSPGRDAYDKSNDLSRNIFTDDYD
jgi:hypothetical protein